MEPGIMTFLPECPHCGRLNMTFYACGEEAFQDGKRLSFWSCGNCGKGVCGESVFPLLRGEFDYARFKEVYPAPSPNTAPSSTPEQVSADFVEAVSSLKNGNYKAASIMARASLEAAVNLFEAKGGNLKQKIDDLAARHSITQNLADWAHEIRGIGNDAAHEGGPISRNDAEQAVHFAEMLFTYLFTLPGMVAERRGGGA